MPYICREHRERLLNRPRVDNPGELAYAITQDIISYLGPAPKFADYATVQGVLDLCGKELYKKMISPYESRKCKENGEVYPIEMVNYEKS